MIEPANTTAKKKVPLGIPRPRGRFPFRGHGIRAWWAGLAMGAVLGGVSAPLGDAHPAASPRAHEAKTLNVKETGHLDLIEETSSDALLEEGKGIGSLSGSVRVSFNVGSIVTGAYTLYLHQGSISGYAHARLHPGHAYASFAGTVSVNHGSGKYAHASGTDALYGTINRSNDRLTVQVIGTLHY